MYYLPNFSDKMPQHKEVKKLLDIAIYHIKTLVKNEAVRVSRIINYKFKIENFISYICRVMIL